MCEDYSLQQWVISKVSNSGSLNSNPQKKNTRHSTETEKPRILEVEGVLRGYLVTQFLIFWSYKPI